MHYQIYRFTGYLLVHLTVPEFFGWKSTWIYPMCHKYTPWAYPNFSMPVAEEKKWKPWDGHRPYAPCAPHAPKNSDTPQTLAISKHSTVWEHLTLHDWLGIMQYFDSNPPISQEEVVKHFAGRADGALKFSWQQCQDHFQGDPRIPAWGGCRSWEQGRGLRWRTGGRSTIVGWRNGTVWTFGETLCHPFQRTWCINTAFATTIMQIEGSSSGCSSKLSPTNSFFSSNSSMDVDAL